MVIRFLLYFYLYTFITILMYYNICVYYYRWFQRQSGDHVGYRSTRLQRLLNNVEVRGDKVKIQLNLQTIHIYIPIYLTQFSYISLFNMTLTFLCINDLETTTFLMTFTSLFSVVWQSWTYPRQILSPLYINLTLTFWLLGVKGHVMPGK